MAAAESYLASLVKIRGYLSGSAKDEPAIISNVIKLRQGDDRKYLKPTHTGCEAMIKLWQFQAVASTSLYLIGAPTLLSPEECGKSDNVWKR